MPYAAEIGWVIAVRTCTIDAYIETAIQDGCDVVVNLGAGLDTRPYRMNLPEGLRWIEVDFPETIAFKEQRVGKETPHCQLQRVALDLSHVPRRQALLDDIHASCKKALILTEGLVPYLSVADVSVFTEDLRARPRFAYWVLEYCSPHFKRVTPWAGDPDLLRKSPFIFEPEGWHDFFAQRGWSVKEMRYLEDEGARLQRYPRNTWREKLRHALRSPKERAIIRESFGYALLERSR
jgi:methyltransferase (TIGR00027 family)